MPFAGQLPNTDATRLIPAVLYSVSDPGAIGAGKLWSDGTTLRLRNQANSGWAFSFAIADLGSAATTAYVDGAIAALVGTAPGVLDTLGEISDALNDDAALYTTLTTLIALKAPLASPTFTGTPAVPTAAPGTNTTQAASTAFVTAAVAAGVSAATGAKVTRGARFSGGTSVPTTSVKCSIRMPFGWSDITRMTIYTDDASGSATVGVKKGDQSAFDAGTMTSIVAAATPTLSAAKSASDATLSGWTKTGSALDFLTFELLTASTLTNVTILLDLIVA